MDFSTVDKKKLKNLSERRHPDYKRLLEHWNFLEACYEGGRAWFDNNIFPYFKEGEDEFKERVARAYRFNHSREIVDLVNKYIFRAPVARNKEDASEALKSFWLNVTRNGMDINGFMRQVSLRSSAQGRIYVVVDSTLVGVAPKTVAEAKELGARVYSYIVKPQDALDMSFDDNGELNWILIRSVRRDDDDPVESSGDGVECFKLWTKTHWASFVTKKVGKHYQVEYENQGEHDLGIVPVIPVDHIRVDDKYSSPALIGDIAYLDRAVANYLSNLDAIIQDQTFSQLAIPAQGLLPGDEAHNKILEMGTKRVFTYDGENGTQPFYMSPDPKQAQVIVTVIKQIINEIYHSVGVAGERTKQDNSMGIDNSSGVAKAYDFERVNALLAAKADALDVVESKIANLVHLWNGEEPPKEDLVQYPQDFDIRGLYDEFEIAANLSLIEAPDVMRREQMKSVLDKLFPRLGKKLKGELLKELEQWPVAPEPIVSTGEGSDLPAVGDKPASTPDGEESKDEG